MSIHRTPKSGLFLLELVIIILFFSVTSAVCVSLFVNAHLVSTGSKDLNRAVLVVETAAESVKASEGDAERLSALLGAARSDDGESYALYYGKGWETVGREDAYYTLTVVPRLGADGMLTAGVSLAKGEQEVYSVEVKRYIG